MALKKLTVAPIVTLLLLMFSLNMGITQDEEPLKVVEEMPRFPGCEHLERKNEKERCSQTELLKYIYGNLIYPDEARAQKLEGTVIIKFIVSERGKIEDVSIARDIGLGCGEAAKNVVISMNDMKEAWVPGKQRGMNVDVNFTLPVRFRLE